MCEMLESGGVERVGSSGGQAAHPGTLGSTVPAAGLFNDKCPRAANELLIQSPCEAEDEEGGRGMELNSTAGAVIPSQHYNIADLVVVVVYFP